MLVFSTQLPIRQEITRRQCLELFIQWIKESPHYKAIADEICFDPDSEEDYHYSKANLSFSVRHFEGEDLELSACRLRNEDEKNRTIWCNDCIFVTENGVKTMLIQLDCHSKEYRTDLPWPKKPHIVGMLVKEVYCDFDGPLPVNGKPIPADESNYSLYRDVMCGKVNYSLPVVYVSRDFMGRTSVDPDNLAWKLSGVAHVFVEDNYEIARRLREDTDQNNAYLGYVGVYFPNTKYCQKHGPEYYDWDRIAMTEGIIHDIWDVLLNRSEATLYTWNQIATLQSRQKMRKMKDISEQTQEELDIYVQTFDIENTALKERNEQLEQKVQSLRAERDALREARTQSSGDGPFYMAGKEEELYPGERNDLLWSILSQVQSRYPEETRPYCLIQSMLEANPSKGTCKKIISEVNRIFSGSEELNARMKNQLKALGFSITEDGAHYKLTFKDPRYMVTVAKTPSDYRWGKNIAAEIKKMLNIEKKI